MKWIKTYRLFESVDDIGDIISTVDDMLLELRDKYIECHCEKKNMAYFKKGGIPSKIGNFIKIELVKPTSSDGWPSRYSSIPSITLSDIKDVIDIVIDYLGSEGYQWMTEVFTDNPLSDSPTPMIQTIPIHRLSGPKASFVEMWFEKK